MNLEILIVIFFKLLDDVDKYQTDTLQIRYYIVRLTMKQYYDTEKYYELICTTTTTALNAKDNSFLGESVVYKNDSLDKVKTEFDIQLEYYQEHIYDLYRKKFRIEEVTIVRKLIVEGNPVLPKIDLSYKSPIGWWEITTEADCEGRTTKNLGILYGHVADIAFYLADKVFYSLQFQPINRKQPLIGNEYILTPKGSEVHINLGIESNTWNMNVKERVEWFTKWLNRQDIIVEDKYYYAAVHLMKKYEI